MKNIPTAEEWLKHFEENAYPGTPISECMIDFAKLHVEAALKAAFEDAPCGSSSDTVSCEDMHEAIFGAYPLEKIV